MSERRCIADEAFVILTKMSQDSNRKLRDVVAALVARSNEPAETAPPRSAIRGRTDRPS